MSDGDPLRIFSLLVENKPGVLFRISSHFRRRNYNIESIAVGPTEDRSIARMVITMIADNEAANSFLRLLRRTIDVIDVTEINGEDAILRELAIIKIRASEPQARNSALMMASAFGARVLHIDKDYVILELTGSPSMIDNFISIASELGLKEVARTGVTALSRG